MAILLNITTVPQDFAAGTYGSAASAINTGKWRVTITPTAASTTYTGGNFHSILGQPHGGLWLNDTNLQLYTTPDDNVAVSFPLTWLAGQSFTLNVDARPGHLTATVTGAATGNNTLPITAGPYLDPALLLEVGRQNGGTNFQFVGNVSPIDDGVISDTITPATIALTGGSVGEKLGFKDVVSPAAIAIVGSVVSEGRGGNSDGVSPASIAIVGGSISVKRAYADVLSSALVSIVGGSVAENQGGLLSLGQTAIDFQLYGFANRPASVVVDTPATGAVVLLCAGGKSSDVSVPWTDSKNAASPVTIGPLVDYPDFAGYGTIIGLTPAPMSGGSAHTFTQPVTTGDENTTFALVALVAGGPPRVTEVHNNVANASGTTQQTSPTISIDGEALLVAYWFGSSPVVPPFSSPPPGTGTPFTAVPDGGFTVARSYLVNNEFGEVQAAMAYLYIPAGSGPSSRSVTWTHSPAQGAQLRLVAIQPAFAAPVTPASIGLVGQAIGERLSLRAVVSPATLQVTGGSIAENVLLMDSVSPATILIAGGSVSTKRTTVDGVLAAALSLSGNDVPDQVSRNQVDTVTPASIVLFGESVSGRIGKTEAVNSAAIVVTGGSIADRVVRADGVSPAVVSLAGAPVLTRWAVVDVVTSALVSIAGSDVQDLVVSGTHDAVTPASLTVVGGVVLTRVTRSIPIAAAIVALRVSTIRHGVSGT